MNHGSVESLHDIWFLSSYRMHMKPYGTCYYYLTFRSFTKDSGFVVNISLNFLFNESESKRSQFYCKTLKKYIYLWRMEKIKWENCSSLKTDPIKLEANQKLIDRNSTWWKQAKSFICSNTDSVSNESVFFFLKMNQFVSTKVIK